MKSGRKYHEIVDELAEDNTIFAKKFLEGWHQMITNGYDDSDLVDAPDNSWLGHYSLTQQGKTEHLNMKFEDFITENGPVTFTDPEVSTIIDKCPHMGSFQLEILVCKLPITENYTSMESPNLQPFNSISVFLISY